MAARRAWASPAGSSPRPWLLPVARRGGAAVPDPDRGRRRRPRTCWCRSTSSSRRARSPSLPRACAGAGARGAGRPARLEWALLRLRRALRGPGDLLERLHQGAGAGRLLLRPVRAALRAARAVGGRRSLARRCLAVLVALALVFAASASSSTRRSRAAAQPEGHRLQPVRVLLPGQLAVLRPEHLRALPRRRDDRGRRGRCCGPARARAVGVGAVVLALLWAGSC